MRCSAGFRHSASTVRMGGLRLNWGGLRFCWGGLRFSDPPSNIVGLGASPTINIVGLVGAGPAIMRPRTGAPEGPSVVRVRALFLVAATHPQTDQVRLRMSGPAQS